jgi:hypothetical protein
MKASAHALRVWVVVTVAASTIGAASPAANAPSPSLRLLARATNPNPTLNSYTASAQLSALLHAVIPIHKTFSGTVYYLRPNRKIEFQDVPGALSRFRDLASTTPTYEQATQQYVITPACRQRNGIDLFPRSKKGRRARQERCYVHQRRVGTS